MLKNQITYKRLKKNEARSHENKSGDFHFDAFFGTKGVIHITNIWNLKEAQCILKLNTMYANNLPLIV